MRKRSIASWLFVLAFVGGLGLGVQSAELAPGREAPDFELKDSAGNVHKLSKARGKYVVLEWTNHGCPFVKKFYRDGHMQALQKTYTGKDVVWYSICSSAPGKQGYCKTEEAAELLSDKDVASSAYLMDPDGAVGKAFGAKTTPHMFIIDPEGKVAYQGAIDSVKSTDTGDIASADNFVQLALDAALSGEVIEKQATQPYGCSVKYQ